MGARAALTVLGLGFLAGCQREAGAGGLPAFAATLPGDTAVVLWGADNALQAKVRAALRPHLGRLPLAPVVREDLIAYVSEPRTRVAWKSLAESTEFREAWQVSGASGTGLFVDPRLLERWLGRNLAQAPEVLRERVATALFWPGLRYLTLALREDAGGWVGEGVLETTGTRAGIGAALAAPQEPGGLLPQLPFEPWLQLEANLDLEVCRAIVRVLGESNDPNSGWMSGLLPSAPLGLAEAVLACFGSRCAFAMGGSVREWVAIQELSALAPVQAALAPFARAGPAGGYLLPGGSVLWLSGSRAVVTGPETRPIVDLTPVALAAPASLALRSRDGFELRLVRKAPEASALQIVVRWR